MERIRYGIGKLQIVEESLYSGVDGNKKSHRFVAEDAGKALIYVGFEKSQLDVAKAFELDETSLTGGGNLYINGGKRLVLAGRSLNYQAIPREAAQRFGELIIPRLRQMHIDVLEVLAEPEGDINPYWARLGFTRVIGRGGRFYKGTGSSGNAYML